MDINMANENLFFDEILENKRDECEESPAKKIKEEYFDSYDGIEPELSCQEQGVHGCDKIASQDGSLKEEKFGDILMKEEIKEENLEDKSSLPDEDEQRLDFQEEKNANATDTERVLQNSLQGKIACPVSSVMEDVFSPPNSEVPLFYRRKLEKKTCTIEKRLKCSFCSYKATRMMHLRTHERTHTGAKPFKCSFCPYRSAQMATLQRHKRTHTGEKPFKCSSCSYQSSERGTLQRHERTHSGEKPFKCNFCPYQASDSGNLLKHERTHTGEKPFKCRLCPYQASQIGSLRKHERTHTGEKPFQCIYCPYQTAYRGNLQRHGKIHITK